MLRNFHLAALSQEGKEWTLKKLTLEQNLQIELSSAWGELLNQFTNDTEEIDFQLGYKLDDNERFIMSPFTLPEHLTDISSTTILDQPAVNSTNEATWSKVKAVVAFAKNAAGEEVILFQSFFRNKIIKPKRILFLGNQNYVSNETQGVQLADQLAAVYLPSSNKLIFKSFRNTNIFLPLASSYREASEADIRAVLAHDKLAPENIDSLAIGASHWFKTRFAMLKDSGLLDDHSVTDLVVKAHSCDLVVHTTGQGSDEKIVFPAQKSDAKKLLQYLNEEVFKGAITDTLFQTNSKRTAQ